MDSKNVTSSSWVKKEQSSEISSCALYKEGYKDILEERRGEIDVAFALKNRDNIPRYKYNRPRDYETLKREVLSSDRVKYTIEKLSLGDKAKEEHLVKEAQEIYSGMAHLLSTRGVRVMAFLVIKVFKSLFRRVYVNEEGVHRLHQLMLEYPVLLMPSHRSYMDFLLVSYVCYHYDLPIPAIAAAMDFKGMKLMGWLLQNCGAFYIRRSFGSDQLYWAVFTEYVQTQLRNGDQPLEFFVEGTRSRTNKSYVPKTGMLSASLESYFKAELPDTMIIPISVTYDRIPEENLYAYELLGVPKPKESTSGLLKARSVLEEDFGSVHIHVGEPISIRQYSLNRIDRVVHSLEPRYINNLRPDERALIRDLAFAVVKHQQARFVVPPGTLVAAVMMQQASGMDVDWLAEKVDWLKMQACNLGAYVDWPGNIPLKEVIMMSIKLHKNILTVDGNGLVRLRPGSPQKGSPRASGATGAAPSTSPSKDHHRILSDASVTLILASYRNHVLHLFVKVAMVMISVKSWSGRVSEVAAEDIYPSYSFLESLLSKDFVFQPGQTEQAFKQAILQLKNSGILVIKPPNAKDPPTLSETPSSSGHDLFLVERSMNEHSLFFCRMFEPFLIAYWVACHYLSTRSEDKFGRPLAKRQKDLASEIQSEAVSLISSGLISHHEILSLDVINNAIISLLDLKALTRDRRNEETWLSPDRVIVMGLEKRIEEFVAVPQVRDSIPPAPLKAKL